MKTIKENWLKNFKKKDLVKYSKKVNLLMRVKLILGLMFLLSIKGFAQDTKTASVTPEIKTHNQIFSLSPIATNVSKVNGLAFGVGHYENSMVKTQTVNGFNVELSPIGLLSPFLAIGLFERDEAYLFREDTQTASIKINGINISSGGFLDDSQVNGANFSVFTTMDKMNGFSASAIVLCSRDINGVSLAGFANFSKNTHGLTVALINRTFNLKGIQLGCYNRTTQTMTGVQIGLINISNQCSGLQIGLLNINKKRALPFINF